jgi:S1-C subfamily serine protease
MPDKRQPVLIIVVVLAILVVVFGLLVVANFVYERFLEGNTTVIADDGRSLSQQGLLITYIEPDSPAAQSPLQRGDIILSIDGTAVTTPLDAQQLVGAHDAGQSMIMVIWDGANQQEVSVTLAVDRPYLGVRLLEATPPTVAPIPATPEFGFVTIGRVLPDSPAEQAGLLDGDVITAVDAQAILSLDELIQALTAKTPGDTALLTIRRGEATLNATVVLGESEGENGRAFLGIEPILGFPTP